jgi:hypothetical protein
MESCAFSALGGPGPSEKERSEVIMELSQLKHVVRPLVPAGLIALNARRRREGERQLEIQRRQKFNSLKDIVSSTIAAIWALTDSQCADADFLENIFIPALGLNDECLHEQPPELSASFGKGLHIWQYPSQLAGYLVWLSRNAAHIESYLEIGCRWGGTFILISEWIRRTGGRLRAVTCVDPIEPTPFIEAYFDLIRKQSPAVQSPIQGTYLCEFSTSATVRRAVDRIRPDFVFIDGDHSLRGALADHLLVRDYARIIVHHDVYSQACPDTTFLWETLRRLESHEFDFVEFVNQYSSVAGQFLGIGVMKRKSQF